MKKRSSTHATFVIERTYPVAAERVFDAWASVKSKSAWFGAPEEWKEDGATFDFRIGGKERLAGKIPNGTLFTFAATYFDIVEDVRIVYAYEMYMNDDRMSVSVATVDLQAVGEKETRLVYTEQGVFLDGLDKPKDREEGTKEIFDKLGKFLAGGEA